MPTNSTSSRLVAAGSVKDYLRMIYLSELENGFTTATLLSRKSGRSVDSCTRILSKLLRKGFTRRVEPRQFVGISGRGGLRGSQPSKYVITESGRRLLSVVLTGGVFDIIHMGHLLTLTEARKLGDILVVVVARNETVEKMKSRKPINDEETRLQVVRSLKPVDGAVLGDREDPLTVVKSIKPDIIVLGFDQNYDENLMANELRRIGLETKVIRLRSYLPGVKTSYIISQVRNIK